MRRRSRSEILWLCLAAVCVLAGCGGGGSGGGSAMPFCNPKHFARACYNGDAYWYNSCGGREDKSEECGTGGCSNGQCAVSTWVKTYGGVHSEIAWAASLTSDGGVVAAGYVSYGGDDTDVLVVKHDESGNFEWAKTFGGDKGDEAWAVQQTADGGYIVGGYRDYEESLTRFGDFWLIKLDSEGNEVWEETYGGEAIEMAYSLDQTADGGFVIAGQTTSYGEGMGDYWIVKTDSSGGQEWAKTFGGSYVDLATAVRQTSDGGYVLLGFSQGATMGDFDVWIIKLDSSGESIWEKTYGGDGDDFAYSIKQTSDGGYIVGGIINFYGEEGREEMWIVKLDSSGEQEWAKTFGGEHNDRARSVYQTMDGGYIAAGYKSFSESLLSRDVWLVKLDSSGNLEWERLFEGTDYDYDDFASSVEQAADGGYMVAGCTSFYGGGGYDFWIIKTDSDGGCGGCFEAARAGR